jgi:hypothetical protein
VLSRVLRTPPRNAAVLIGHQEAARMVPVHPHTQLLSIFSPIMRGVPASSLDLTIFPAALGIVIGFTLQDTAIFRHSEVQQIIQNFLELGGKVT